MEELKKLKKKLGESLEDIQNQIASSHSFNLLKERYEALSIFHQKIIKYSLVGSVLVLVGFFPIYYFFLSMGYWGDFKEKHLLSIKLLRTRSHQAHHFEFSRRDFKKNLKEIVEKYQSQNYSIKDQAGLSDNDQFKKVNYTVTVDHLNVRQVMKLGAELHHLPIAVVSSLSMTESSKYPKHYDVKFVVFSYFSKQSSSSKPRKSDRLQNKLDKVKKVDLKKSKRKTR